MIFRISTIVPFLVLAASLVSGQQTSEYVDPSTGIKFQRLLASGWGTSFGIALPPVGTEPTNEFIGQLVGPTVGWTGATFGYGMLNSILLVAWVNGKDIVHSFRFTSSYNLPELYPQPTTLPAPKLERICGTSNNGTHLTLTFKCTNCHQWETPWGSTDGFDIQGDFTVQGWAWGADTPADPSNPASAFMQHHGFSQFGMMLVNARSEDYAKWRTCKDGGEPEPSSSSSSSSSTSSAASTTSAAATSATSAAPPTSSATTVASTSSAAPTTSALPTSSDAPSTASSTPVSTKVPSTSVLTSKKPTVPASTTKPTVTPKPPSWPPHPPKPPGWGWPWWPRGV